MNKYNIQAIRSELDGYIRSFAWKKFRARFQILDAELCRAVIEHRPNPHRKTPQKKRNASTLLHALCECVHAIPPVPIDLLESILKLCPHLLYTPPSVKTPLAIVLDRQGSPAILECLLMNDPEGIALYRMDKKTGDTPLLRAIKQDASDEVIQLLVDYDRKRSSLLIPSKKRNRVPLYYVVHQTLPFMDLSMDEIPTEVEYIIFQTELALQIRNGDHPAMTNKKSSFPHTVDKSDDYYDELGDEFDDENDGFWETENSPLTTVIATNECCDDYVTLQQAEEEHVRNLLRAVITCAHFLGDKYAILLINTLLFRLRESDLCASPLDYKTGNTVLHCICQSRYDVFIESSYLEGRMMVEEILQRDVRQAKLPNQEGLLPLHIALMNRKPWKDVIRPLLDSAHDTIFQPTTVEKRLPLHLAILSYTSGSTEIFQIWKMFPEAASIRDPFTHLFPFQMAALSVDYKKTSSTVGGNRDDCNHDNGDFENNDIAKLSTIYFLLRAAPTVLKEYFVGNCL